MSFFVQFCEAIDLISEFNHQFVRSLRSLHFLNHLLMCHFLFIDRLLSGMQCPTEIGVICLHRGQFLDLPIEFPHRIDGLLLLLTATESPDLVIALHLVEFSPEFVDVRPLALLVRFVAS